MSDSEHVIKELQLAINQYGIKCIWDFEAKYFVNYRFFIKIPYTISLKDIKLNNFDSSEQDYYLLRMNTYQNFWKNWNEYKRILKIRAFT